MTEHRQGLGEFGRIARFFRPLAEGFPGSLNLTDDAALLDIPHGFELVVTTDAIVGGIHFLPSDRPGDIAHKALRVNLSDLAAKGAQPFAYTLTLALHPEITDVWVESFAAALSRDQEEFGIKLAGGDSVSTSGPIWMSITAFGLVAAGRMVLRSGARPGDRVFVTGTIGDAALGLAALRGEFSLSDKDRRMLADRYHIPQPRNGLAEALADNAHAAIDISDGLAADFWHLCRASGVRGVIETRHIPLSPAAQRAVDANPRLLAAVYSGGDDYEILFTAPPEAVGELLEMANLANVPLTEIGRIECGEGEAFLLDADGLPIILDRMGWAHG